MALETVTVGNLVGRVGEIVAGTTSPQATYASQIKRALHSAVREWVNKCKPSCLHMEAATPITLTAGTRDYSLADDFASMVDPGVWCTATPFSVLRYITMQDYIDRGLVDSDRESDPPTHYCLPHSDATSGIAKIRFSPWPSSSTRVITYRYIAIPASIESASDATVLDKRIPPNLHHGFVWGAIVNVPHLLEDQSKLGLFESRWRSFLADTKAESNRVIGAVRQRQTYGRGRRGGGYPPVPTIAGTADDYP